MSRPSDSLSALHAYLSQRCQRAYLHEVRNSLQGIYTGFDVLSRLNTDNPTLPRAREVTKNAIVNHEHNMRQVLLQLIQPEEAPAATAVDSVLQEIRGFLNNDAAVHEIALRASPAPELHLTVRPLALRTALLGIAVYFIDSQTGGEIKLTAFQEGERVGLEVAANGSTQQPTELQEWLLARVGDLVRAEGGSIESNVADARNRAIKLFYRAASPAAIP